ncbi:hypothetical protein [Streptomyces marincola]|uniref:hypothetical protein n=1 Tax=Streptomyces marincola TaxID=2878388 RepID=UPI001CF2365B|nr:hypothetical protein [Streptomyces marincola]UCM89344.1 hypothetical protein LC193_16090 [Streptomyces marincola]
MNGSWFLVKYVDDVFRNEPVNVGVVVTADRGVGSHFLGQRPDGSINGQRIGKRVSGIDTYRAWVRFIRKEAARGNLDARVESLSKRVGESYLIERRGPILDAEIEKTPQALADELFTALVSLDVPQAQPLVALAEDTFKQLAFPPGHGIDRNVDYQVKVRDVPQLLTFDYRYAAGRTTLMDRVSLSRPGKRLVQSVNDLLYRIEAVEKQRGIGNFVALYSGADCPPQAERQLELLNKFAHTVDLSAARAKDDISQIIGVPAQAV